MYGLFDCYGNMIGRYKTERGLKCAATRNRYKLWNIYDNSKVEDRREYNLVWYSRLLEIKV